MESLANALVFAAAGASEGAAFHVEAAATVLVNLASRRLATLMLH
jgi:hypothetical protein